MLAWILERCGRNPGFLIGGVPADFPVSARLTSSDLFVIEADEYDTAFFDKRSKFVHYRPKTAIINNIEFDHADIFDDLASIERQFRHFVRIIPRSGLIVSNASDEVVKRVLTQTWTPVEGFGGTSEWGIGSLDADGSFEVVWRGATVGYVKWALTGAHNRMNALAAIVAARHAGADPKAAIEALSSFGGVRRRMELRGVERGVTVYDDFAHHPTAIRTTLEGLRAKVGGARILAVLEPRSNTMKQGRMKDALPASLAAADGVYFYASGLGWDPVALFRASGREVHAAESVDLLVGEIARRARTGDQIVVMSNGGFGGIHGKLLAALRAGAE
jgi:UDP-N-acetylmuramate: L-alanyl-gamma-D-glutamyl-meso-diaminopimelate ligase